MAMMRMARLSALAAAALALLASLSACENTIHGVGADAAETNEAIHEAVQ